MSKSEIVRALSDTSHAEKQIQEIRTVAELQRQLTEIDRQIGQIRETTEQQTADSLGVMSQISQQRLSEALEAMTRQAASAYDQPIQQLAGQIRAVTESMSEISDQAATEIPKMLEAIQEAQKTIEAKADNADQSAGEAKGASKKAVKQAQNAAIHAHNTGKLMVVGMALSALMASLVTCGIWLNVM